MMPCPEANSRAWRSSSQVQEAVATPRGGRQGSAPGPSAESGTNYDSQYGKNFDDIHHEVPVIGSQYSVHEAV